MVATLAAVFLLAVTACAQAPRGQVDPTPDSPLPASPPGGAESAAIGLVNIWRVSGAADEKPDTWLRLEAPAFQLWRDCGMIDGSWRATESLFLASTYGASGECVTGATLPRVAWLESVTGYRAAGASWELTDANGAVVATLTIDGNPDAIPTAAEFYTQPPVITAAMRETLRQPASLPPEFTPASSDDLVGRWVPVSPSGTSDSHVFFAADGTWTGSDGCNGGQGRWAADGHGALLSTAGASTLIACEGAAVPYWVAQARLTSVDDGVLRLLDAAGAELGQLKRD
ncbi:META domain-containing protein [Cryobacterium suzukii]|uniref:META domain-containing protein n=1 Tax=Cryobacterium suzukii TaxID=1259198 RepID=UPI00141BA4A4|nr:META domain-containing protein [Cryobacterium suzukii]